MLNKQKYLSVAIGAVVAGAGVTAQAASLSDTNLGSYLSFPYYSVNGGNDTLMSVVNSTASGKVVKVRFKEAKNTQEVLDFNVFLSPFDVWTSSVSAVKDASGAITGVQVKWNDTSCVVPGFAGNTATFTNGRLTERDAAGNIIDNSVARMTEGHFEVIEMGAIDPASTVGGKFTHVAGVPPGCAWLQSAGNLYSDSATVNPTYAGQVGNPTGGLFGSATVINVAGGTSIGIDATAMKGIWGGANHYGPGSTAPTFGAAAPTANFVADGKYYAVTTSGARAGVDAVSIGLMKSAIMGEWLVDPSIGGSTDIVVTLPTRQNYLANTGTSCGLASSLPFTSNGFCANGAPEPVVVSRYDREEQTTAQGLCPSPIVPGSACAASAQSLPWETTVFTVAGSNALSSGSGNKVSIPALSGATSGWFKMSLGTANNYLKATVTGSSDPACAPGSTITTYGLPADGFIANKFVNGNVGGVLSNYGNNYALKSEKTVNCP